MPVSAAQGGTIAVLVALVFGADLMSAWRGEETAEGMSTVLSSTRS